MNLRDKNNFDFLRFLATSLVLFSHSFSLVYGNDKREVLRYLTDGQLTFGRVAVIVFFIISGFLILGSWDNRRQLATFMLARLRRIFPALGIMLLITVIVGAMLTTVNMVNYFPSAVRYFVKNIFLYKNQYELGGIFNENPFPSVVNGSLWTLSLEFTCYVMIGLLGVLRILNRTTVLFVWAGFIGLYLSHIISSFFLREFTSLAIWFSSGMLAYLYKDFTLRNTTCLGLFGLIIISIFFQVNLIFLSPVIAYLLIQLAYVKSPLNGFGKYGDFSYGMYIYAFPIQQLVVMYMMKSSWLPMAWWVCCLIAFPLTLLCAVLSWNLIEKNFLKMKPAANLGKVLKASTEGVA